MNSRLINAKALHSEIICPAEQRWLTGRDREENTNDLTAFGIVLICSVNQREQLFVFFLFGGLNLIFKDELSYKIM